MKVPVFTWDQAVGGAISPQTGATVQLSFFRAGSRRKKRGRPNRAQQEALRQLAATLKLPLPVLR